MHAEQVRAILAGSTILILVAVSFTSGDNPCTYKDPVSGRVYDLRPLISPNGSYTWTQQVYAITDNSYDSLVPAVIMNYTFQLQICKNIETQTLPKKCNVTGAIYAWNPTSNDCVTWGNANVSAFDVTPFGVVLQLYHGSAVNAWSRFSTNIYFSCNNITMAGPYLERMKTDINQAHFNIVTKYVC